MVISNSTMPVHSKQETEQDKCLRDIPTQVIEDLLMNSHMTNRV